MSQPTALFRTALVQLWRGGQRAWVSLLCIAFGVMSLVSMSLLAYPMDVFVCRVPLQWRHRWRERSAALGRGDQIEHERFGAVQQMLEDFNGVEALFLAGAQPPLASPELRGLRRQRPCGYSRPSCG